MSTPEERARNTERHRRWWEKNKERWRAYLSAYQKSDKAHAYANEYYKKYRQEKPEVARAYPSKRNAIEHGITIIEPVNFKAIMERDKMVCQICHKKVTRRTLSFDHIIPLSAGGPHIESNIQVTHRSCNASKGNGRLPSQTRVALAS